MKKCLLVLVILLVLLYTTAGFAEKMRIAVVNLKSTSISQKDAVAITNILRNQLIENDAFLVVERSQMNAILNEQGLQQSGCTDSNCAIEIGKLLSAKKILIGDISSISGKFIITVRIIDVEKGFAEYSSTEAADTIIELPSAVKVIAKRLIDKVNEKTQISYTGYYLRGIVPGWSQFHSDNYVRGWIYSGTFLSAAGFFAWSYYDYTDKKSDYNKLGIGTTQSVFDSKASVYKSARDRSLISLGVLCSIYLWSWIDTVFFSSGDFMAKRQKEKKVGSKTASAIHFFAMPALNTLEKRLDFVLVINF